MSIGVAILGATGSIGASTLDVIARHPDHFRCVAVSARSDIDGMLAICRRHRPELAAMSDPEAAATLAARLRTESIDTEVVPGEAGLLAVAEHPAAEQVMAAIVGAAGLLPTLAAARSGRRILLASKESLVMSGALLMDAITAGGGTLLSVIEGAGASTSPSPQLFATSPDNVAASEPPAANAFEREPPTFEPAPLNVVFSF